MFRGYRLFRQDPQWLNKLLILSLILFSTAFIPLLGQILIQGWLALVFRRVVRGDAQPFPELQFDLDYLGKLLGVGIKPFLVNFLWQIPVGLTVGVGISVAYAAMLAALFSGDEDMVLAAMACFSGAMVLILPIVIAWSVPVWVATARSEYADDIGEGFRFGEVVAFSRRYFWRIFKVLLVYALLSLLLLPLLMVCTLYLGLFPFAVVIMICQQVYLADVYRDHVQAGGAAWPTKPTPLD